jgi:murein L,D-transpeptidase YafK
VVRARRIALGVPALVGVVVLSLSVWDFLQLGRHAPPLAPTEVRATLILVEKSARRMTLLHDGEVLATYPISLGGAPVGPKQQEGDQRTPEGRYFIDFRHARSHEHLALRISYPNATDRTSAQRRGGAPGGDIMIHGLPNGLGWLGRLHLWLDWTDGCVAVTDRQMDEIWPLVAMGTPVEIRP